MSGQTDEYFELLSTFATEERSLAYLFSYKQTAKSNARFIRKKIFNQGIGNKDRLQQIKIKINAP